MPLTSVSASEVWQQCAVCGERRRHDVATLVVDAGTSDNFAARIVLPMCPRCGGVEHLMQTLDAAPPQMRGGRADLHRRAVNWLVAHVVAEGTGDAGAALRARVHPALDMPLSAPPFAIAPPMKRTALRRCKLG